MTTPTLARILQSLAALSLGVIALAGAPALAQGGPGLPDDLPRAQSPSDAQVQQIQAFVRHQIDALKSGERAEVEAARDAILAPLEGEAVAVAFRLRVSETLAPELDQLARNADEHLAFNALRIAGSLATDAAADIIRRSLTDQRVAVRYGAALAARLTIEAVDARRSPLPQNQLDALVESLKAALAAETDPEVFGGLVAAMTSVDHERRGPSHTRALTDLSRIVGERLVAETGQRPSPTWARAYQRAIGAAQGAVAEQLAAAALDRIFARTLASSAGQALAYTSRRLTAEESVSDAEGPALRDLVASAEFALLLIDQELGKRPPGDRLLLKAFDAAATDGPNAFLEESLRWIGPQGFLTKDPYDRAVFNAGR